MIPAFRRGGVKIPCLASRKNWPIFLHDVKSLLSGRLFGVVRLLEDDDGAMGEDIPHIDVALSLGLLLHDALAEMLQVVVLVATVCGDESDESQATT